MSVSDSVLVMVCRFTIILILTQKLAFYWFFLKHEIGILSGTLFLYKLFKHILVNEIEKVCTKIYKHAKKYSFICDLNKDTIEGNEQFK